LGVRRGANKSSPL